MALIVRRSHNGSSSLVWTICSTTRQLVFVIQYVTRVHLIVLQVGQSGSRYQINSMLYISHCWQLIREILREHVSKFDDDRFIAGGIVFWESFATSLAIRTMIYIPLITSFSISLGLIKLRFFFFRVSVDFFSSCLDFSWLRINLICCPSWLKVQVLDFPHKITSISNNQG